MESDVAKWLKELAEPFLREIGIRANQCILDFGCGPGYYAIPAAQIAGRKGQVYAIDKNQQVLDELHELAQRKNLNNIQTIKTHGELALPFTDQSFDTIIIYDVLHSEYFSVARRRQLLDEVYRIARPGALLSVFPAHMDPNSVRSTIEGAGFQFERSIQRLLLHYYNLTEEEVLNFRRKTE